MGQPERALLMLVHGIPHRPSQRQPYVVEATRLPVGARRRRFRRCPGAAARTAGAAAAGDSVMVDASMRERLRYSVGSVGTAIVGGSVRRSVAETEQSLKDMKKTIKTA